jgi:molybdopterin synthase sulfur carrier subunit
VSTLTVRYFASLREQLGVDRETVPVPADGASLAELLERLAALHDESAIAALTGPGVRIAVDDELVDGDPGQLAPGTVVAFLPPVTGG